MPEARVDAFGGRELDTEAGWTVTEGKTDSYTPASGGGTVVIESGFPLSARITDQTGAAADYVEVTGITTAAASLIVAVFAVNNNGGSRTSFAPTIGGTLISSSGLTFSRVSLDQSIFASNSNGVGVYTAVSSAALSSKTLRFTRPAGTDYATFQLTVYSCTGANTTAGSVAGTSLDGSTSIPQNGLIRPYGDAGSLIVFAAFGMPNATTMLPSGSWDTGPVGSVVSSPATGHVHTTDRTALTVGANTSQTYSGWGAVEITASGASVLAPVKLLGAWGSAAGGTTTNSATISATATGQGMLVVLTSFSYATQTSNTPTATGLTFTKRTTTSSGGPGSVDIWTAPFTGSLSSLAVQTTLPVSANFAYKVIALDNVHASSAIGTVVNPTVTTATAFPDVSFASCTAGSMLITNAWANTAPGSGTLNSETILIENQNDAGIFRRNYWCTTGTNVIGGTGYSSGNNIQCGIEIKSA